MILQSLHYLLGKLNQHVSDEDTECWIWGLRDIWTFPACPAHQWCSLADAGVKFTTADCQTAGQEVMQCNHNYHQFNDQLKLKGTTSEIQNECKAAMKHFGSEKLRFTNNLILDIFFYLSCSQDRRSYCLNSWTDTLPQIYNANIRWC